MILAEKYNSSSSLKDPGGPEGIYMMHFKNICIAIPAHFDLLTYCPLCKRIWDLETSKFKKV